jgi:hypothetical protein
MLGSARQEAGPHGVPRIHRGVEADALGIVFDDIGDRLRGQALAHCAASSDCPKYRPSGDAGGLQPRLQRGYRAGHAAADDGDRLSGALLVGLAVPDRNLEAEFALLEVFDVGEMKTRLGPRDLGGLLVILTKTTGFMRRLQPVDRQEIEKEAPVNWCAETP